MVLTKLLYMWPLRIILPANRAIEEPPPEIITFKVQGTGWDLFNLIFFNSAAICSVDLSKAAINVDEYEITRNQIIKSIAYFNNVEAIESIPEAIS